MEEISKIKAGLGNSGHMSDAYIKECMAHLSSAVSEENRKEVSEMAAKLLSKIRSFYTCQQVSKYCRAFRKELCASCKKAGLDACAALVDVKDEEHVAV